jgi:hypothetical protein
MSVLPQKDAQSVATCRGELPKISLKTLGAPPEGSASAMYPPLGEHCNAPPKEGTES